MWKLEGHTRLIERVAFSPDGTRLVSLAQDATLRLWDMDTGQQIHVWKEVWALFLAVWRNNQTVQTQYKTHSVDLPSPTIQMEDRYGRDDALLMKAAKPGKLSMVDMGDWMQCNGKSLLWLTPAYRASASTTHGDQVVLARPKWYSHFSANSYE